MKENDPINPNHYRRNNIEAIDFIEASVQNLEGFEAYLIGSIIKYLYRWKEKNGIIDLKKAQWFLEKLIKELES